MKPFVFTNVKTSGDFVVLLSWNAQLMRYSNSAEYKRAKASVDADIF